MKDQVPQEINTSEVKEDEIKNIKINKDNNLEIIFKLDFNKNDEKKESIEGEEEEEKISLEIYKVYEISDKRIAIETDDYLKIYSIKNFQLITEIKTEYDYESVELKNKDIIIAYYDIKFYKLTGNNYEFYNTIKQDNGKIFCIYELKSENLVFGLSHCLLIYRKKEGEYKLISKIKMAHNVKKIIETKNDILSVFCLAGSSYATADLIPCNLRKLDIKNKKIKSLNSDCFDWENDRSAFWSCNFYIYKNKYLFARYAKSFDIYDINNDMKCISKKLKLYFSDYFEDICEYNNNKVIIFPSLDIYTYDEKNDAFIFDKKINIKIDKPIGIMKLSNNDFIIYSKYELYLINNLNK